LYEDNNQVKELTKQRELIELFLPHPLKAGEMRANKDKVSLKIFSTKKRYYSLKLLR
jgi:hypothetical protein